MRTASLLLTGFIIFLLAFQALCLFSERFAIKWGMDPFGGVEKCFTVAQKTNSMNFILT